MIFFSSGMERKKNCWHSSSTVIHHMKQLSSHLSTTLRQGLLTFWIFTSGLMMRAGSRPTYSRRMEKSASYYFQVVLTLAIAADPYRTVLPIE